MILHTNEAGDVVCAVFAMCANKRTRVPVLSFRGGRKVTLRMRFYCWYAQRQDEKSRNWPLAYSVVMPWTGDGEE